MVIDVEDAEDIDYLDLAQMVGCAVVYQTRYELYVGILRSAEYRRQDNLTRFDFGSKTFNVSNGHPVRLEMVR